MSRLYRRRGDRGRRGGREEGREGGRRGGRRRGREGGGGREGKGREGGRRGGREGGGGGKYTRTYTNPPTHMAIPAHSNDHPLTQLSRPLT